MDQVAVQQQGMDLQQALTELELLRQDNAALLEALRLAQLGGVDLQGHLSKFNPDAAEQGIFTQDWELRYFVLSGTLLKYYTSERDVGRQYRGVLSLEDCIVEVEEPLSVKGPFIFDINDPDGDTLLRLSADKLETAKTWVKTLHAVGLRVRGYRRLTAISLPGWQPLPAAAAAAAAGQQQGLGRSFASLGRALSVKWSSAHVPGTVSMDSELSIRRDPPPPPGLHHRGDLQVPVVPAAAVKQDSGTRSSSSSSAFETAAGAAPLPQTSSVGPLPAAAAAAQAPGRPASSQDVLLSDEDDAFLGASEDESDPLQTTRLARLRQKCRWLKSELRHHSRVRRRHTVDAVAAAPAPAAAASMAASVPGLTGRAAGGAAAAPQGDSSSGSSAAGSSLAAAAAAAAPGSSRRKWGCSSSSRRHQRTLSAPIQKQVSWRWERLDVGDELPDADLSDSDGGSSSDASGSSSGSTQGAAGQQLASRYAQQPQLDPLHPVMQQQQQQQQLLDAGVASAADSHLFSQQQQQQQPGYFSDHLEGIQEEDPPKRPQRISAFGEATEAAAIAAAGGVSAAGAPDTPPPSGGGGAVPGVAGPPTPPPMTSAGPSAAVRGSGFKPGMGSIKPQGTTGVVKPKRGPMVGYSPVHVSAKDSILTEADRHGVMRHEGFLNLGVVVLLASNIRMIIGNLLTYGLRLKVNRELLQSVLPLPLSSDDLATLAAIPGSCLVFALGALLVEWLGLRLLRAQERLLQGLQKKGVAPEEMARKGAAISSRQERLLLLLNLLNAGGSLVLPCWLVLSNQSSLVPAFVLTVVAIVLSMKLATYAHCNTTLRAEARALAVAAAAANYPIPSTPLQPASFSSSGTGSGLWSRAARGGGLATATTHTPAAGYGSGDNVPALRSSATDPHPFLMAGLRRTSSTLRRQAAAGVVVVRDVVYPANLVPSDLAYFLAAPTLTYQLNFPRLRQRRWRLLSRWLLLAVLTAITMSFMQIQFLLPCMQSSLVPLREMNYLHFMERLLRLAVPNTAVWLAMFYLVFHLWLNILGEALMFGDRMFYKEWWNAATLAEYWKLWNLPVHKWMLRTIFFPLVRRGAPRLASLLFVFFISAVMHELAVGVPLRMLRGWAFWGMMLQVPLITATELLRKRLKADTLGNMVFWASFCVLGQPMCLVLYYHDFLLSKLGEQGWQAVAAQGEGVAARMSSGTFNSTLSTVAGSLVY